MTTPVQPAPPSTTTTTTVRTADPPDPHLLARPIIGWCLWALSILGVSAIIAVAMRPDETVFRGIKDILGIVLPVISAWVGTILAFFFGRANYDAASKNTESLLRLTSVQKLQSTRVDAAMIPLDKADKLILTTAKPEAQVKIQDDMLDALEKAGRNRLPVLDEQGRVKYVAHKSALDRFVVVSLTASPPKLVPDLTLADLVAHEAIGQQVKGFATVRGDSSLAEAKALMDRMPYCLDVFITDDGNPTGKAVGWLTNVIVLEQANA